MSAQRKIVRTTDLIEMKREGVKIVALTAYDATFARLEDEAGIDVMLVGDSLGMVIKGSATTLPVTVDDVVYHTRACRRGVKHALLVSDMPFMSFQVSAEDALRNAGRCLKEGSAAAVKLEGGESIAETIRRMTEAGIPVMGHIGMQPQMVRVYGGFKIQGKEEAQAERIRRDALAVQDAGAFAVVLEKVPNDLAADITKKLEIPTIGIAAGPHCDGQILVSYDMLGLADKYHYRFVRKYANLANTVRDAVRQYGEDIRSGGFPAEDESYE